jgi:hypothetical protein
VVRGSPRPFRRRLGCATPTPLTYPNYGVSPTFFRHTCLLCKSHSHKKEVLVVSCTTGSPVYRICIRVFMRGHTKCMCGLSYGCGPQFDYVQTKSRMGLILVDQARTIRAVTRVVDMRDITGPRTRRTGGQKAHSFPTEGSSCLAVVHRRAPRFGLFPHFSCRLSEPIPSLALAAHL